jgi:hypothetical protein
MLTVYAPPDINPNATQSEVRIWKKLLDEHIRHMTYLERNVQALYSIVWKQCTDSMQQRLKAQPSFPPIHNESNGLKLLGLLRLISFNQQIQRYLPHVIHEALRRFYGFHQGRNLTTAAYLQTFQNFLEIVFHIGGSIGDHPRVMERVMT